MRAPDDTAGKKGMCPQCGCVMDVPARTADVQENASPQRPASPAPRTGNSAAGQPAGDKIDYPCPYCRLPVRTPATAAGKKGKCPNCGAVVQFPEPSRPNSPTAGGTRGQTGTADRKPQQGAVSDSAAPAAQPPPSQPGMIEFTCPKCHTLFRTPAAAAGKKGQCPSCRAVFTISSTGPTPAAAATPKTPATPRREPFRTGPAPQPKRTNATPGLMALPDAGAGLTPLTGDMGLTPLDDDPLGLSFEAGISPAPLGPSGNPFSDRFGSAAPRSAPAANPYQSPSLGSAGYPTRKKKKSSSDTVVVAPAIAMIVIGSLSLLVAIPVLIFQVIGFVQASSQMSGETPPQVYGVLVGVIVGGLVSVVIHILIITGGVKMLKFESWGAALTGAILLILPCTACWVGLPIGVWATIVLSLGDVRARFR